MFDPPGSREKEAACELDPRLKRPLISCNKQSLPNNRDFGSPEGGREEGRRRRRTWRSFSFALLRPVCCCVCVCTTPAYSVFKIGIALDQSNIPDHQTLDSFLSFTTTTPPPLFVPKDSVDPWMGGEIVGSHPCNANQKVAHHHYHHNSYLLDY